MTKTSHKSALMDLLDKARAETREFEDRLSQAERVATGEPNHWSAKDVKAHIIVWNDRLAAQLEAAARGQQPELFQDFDEANRQIFEANRARSWGDLLDHEGEVYSRLAAAVDALPGEILDDPERFEWTNGRPLWWRISFTAYYHALDHLSNLYLERGDGDLAAQLQEQIAVSMGALDDSQSWQGVNRYNLACFHARTAQPETALEALRHALQLNPGLVDWSKEDADLDSLRDLPAYQALYEG